MSIPVLFISAFIIGLSGAMMPGPLLTYVINGSLCRGFIAGFGRKILNDRIYRGLVTCFGVILIYFAGRFILESLQYFF